MLLEFKNVTGITKGFNLTDISFQIPAGYLVGQNNAAALYCGWEKTIYRFHPFSGGRAA